MSKQTKDSSNTLITAVILSGGAGQRFGGVDKGLELYEGKPLIEHVINRVSPQVDNIVLCVNRNQERYRNYGYPLVVDQRVDTSDTSEASNPYQGPLAGLSSAITYLTIQTSGKSKTIFESNSNHCLLISSCDSPHLPVDYVAKLSVQMRQHKSSSAVVNDGSRNQNLHCVIDSSAWQSLQSFYQGGGRAMHRWHKKNGSIEVNFSDQADCFSNINSVKILS